MLLLVLLLCYFLSEIKSKPKLILCFLFRISTIFAILSAGILAASTILALVGHCVKGHKMLIASGLYAIGGENIFWIIVLFTYILSGFKTSNQ